MKMPLLKKASVGLDIADNVMDVVRVEKSGDAVSITKANRIELPRGILERGRIKDEKKLGEYFKKLLAGAKPEKITSRELNFFLPESQIYSLVAHFDLPLTKPLTEYIEEEIRAGIPLEFGDVVYAHVIRKQDSGSVEVLIVAAQKSVVGEWYQFFKKQGVTIPSFDIETVANYRGLYSHAPKGIVCVFDIGKYQTKISIFDTHGLGYAHVLDEAGDAITDSIARELDIDREAAEEKKVSVGLSGKKTDQKVRGAIQLVLDEILKELKESVAYYESHTGEAVSDIVLIGGSSLMKGMTEYFAESLKRTVIPGEACLDNPKKFTNTVSKTIESKHLLGALGAALRTTDSRWDQDPLIAAGDAVEQIEERKQDSKKAKKKESIDAQSKEYLYPEKYKKEQFQQIILAVILLVGAALIVGAYFYRFKTKQLQRAETQQFGVDAYSVTSTIAVDVPIATRAVEYTKDRVRGRVSEKVITETQNFKSSYDAVHAEAENEFRETETLWENPVKISDQTRILTQKEFAALLTGVTPSGLTPPVALQFLYFSEQDARSQAIETVKEKLDTSTQFILRDISFGDILPTTNPNIFTLQATVEILAPQLFPGSGAVGTPVIPSAATSTVPSPGEYVSVTAPGVTPVFSAPSEASNRVTAIQEGQRYMFIEQRGAWVRLQVDDETDGWIPAAAIGLESAQEVSLQIAEPQGGDAEPQPLYTVRITQTGLGFLNVRAKPTTDSAIVTKVIPGEVIPVFAESDDWLKTVLENGEEGWVYGIYTARQ